MTQKETPFAFAPCNRDDSARMWPSPPPCLIPHMSNTVLPVIKKGAA